MDDTTAIDLKPENVSTIGSMIATRTIEIMKREGLTRGRARLKASDEIGPTLNPSITGTDLDKWYTNQIRSLRPHQYKKSAHAPSNGFYDLPTGALSNHPATFNITQEMTQSLNGLGAGKMRLIVFETEDRMQKAINAITNVATALGWRKIKNKKVVSVTQLPCVLNGRPAFLIKVERST